MPRLRVPPPSVGTEAWMWAVTDALNRLPPFVMFNGDPNTSGISADGATLGFNVESGATQRIWVNQSGTTTSWSWLSYI